MLKASTEMVSLDHFRKRAVERWMRRISSNRSLPCLRRVTFGLGRRNPSIGIGVLLIKFCIADLLLAACARSSKSEGLETVRERMLTRVRSM